MHYLRGDFLLLLPEAGCFTSIFGVMSLSSCAAFVPVLFGSSIAGAVITFLFGSGVGMISGITVGFSNSIIRGSVLGPSGLLYCADPSCEAARQKVMLMINLYLKRIFFIFVYA